MTIWSLLALAGAMTLLAATPGPGVAVTVARALSSGFADAVVVVLGIVAGDLVFLLLAIFGLAALAGLLGGLFVLVKLAGGAYLIWLGWRIWHAPAGFASRPLAGSTSRRANFLSGLAITLANPKVIVFYLGFLPTFLDLSALSPADVLWVALVVSAVLAAVLTSYAFAAHRARRLFTHARAVRRLNRGAGGMMMATGVVLVTRP